MNHHFQELKKFMSKFLDIEAIIAKLPVHEDNAALKAEILAQVKEANDAQNARITDLETALFDTVNHLANGDAAAAQATAAAALPQAETADAAAKAGADASTDATVGGTVA